MITWIKEKANNKFVQFSIYLVVFFGIALLVCNVPPIKDFLGDAYAQTLATLIATLPVIAALMVQTKSLTLQIEGLKVQMKNSESEAKRYNEERTFRILQHLLDDYERIKSLTPQDELTKMHKILKGKPAIDEGVQFFPSSLERYQHICFALNAFFFAYPEQQEKKLTVYQVKSYFSSEEVALLKAWKKQLAKNGDYRLCTLVKVLTTKQS